MIVKQTIKEQEKQIAGNFQGKHFDDEDDKFHPSLAMKELQQFIHLLSFMILLIW